MDPALLLAIRRKVWSDCQEIVELPLPLEHADPCLDP